MKCCPSAPEATGKNVQSSFIQTSIKLETTQMSAGIQIDTLVQSFKGLVYSRNLTPQSSVNEP